MMPTIYNDQKKNRSAISTYTSLFRYTNGGRRGRDCVVVGFTTTYIISAYRQYRCEFETHSRRGVPDTTLWDCRSRDCVVIGFTTTYMISDYRQYRCEFGTAHGEVYLIQHYVIKFACDLR
jgi:hypothetical protein